MAEELTPEAQKLDTDLEAAAAHPGVGSVTNVFHDLEPLQAEAHAIVRETKAGYKTTEFWLSLASGFAVAFGAVPTPHDAKGIVIAALVAIYAVARGLAKKGTPNVDPA